MIAKITIDDLMRDPAHRSIIENLKKRLGDPLPDIVVDFLIDQVTLADVVPMQVAQWVSRTLHIVERIKNGQAVSSDYSLCWIKIFEIMDALPDYFSKYQNNILLNSSDLLMKYHIKIGQEIHNHLVSLLASLSDGEKVVLEYERNCNAHIFQNGYRPRVRITEDDKLVDIKSTYRKNRSIREIKGIIDKILEKHSVNDDQFLMHVVSIIYPHLVQIQKKINIWSS